MNGVLDGTLTSSVYYGTLFLFSLLYIIAYFRIFWNWNGRKRHEAASCAISLLHSTTTCILAAKDFFSFPWQLGSTNTASQNFLLDFSTAYFTVDLLHFLLFVPDDYLFIFHHLATTTYMYTSRLYNYGAMSAICLIFLGEVTSPLQNVWTLARMAKDTSPLANKCYIILSPPFTIIFTLVRGGIGPVYLFVLSKFFLTGGADGGIPRWLACTWVVKVTIAIVGSGLWVYKLWVGLFKFYRNKKARSGKKAS